MLNRLKVRLLFLLPLVLWLSVPAKMAAQGQEWSLAPQDRIARIKQDVYLLASDSLLGREAGTKGEIMAMHYLARQFQKISLKPVLDDNTYFQPVPFTAGLTYEDNTRLAAGHQQFSAGKDFFPLSLSASGKVEAQLKDLGHGLDADDQDINDFIHHEPHDLEGRIFLMDIATPEAPEGGHRDGHIADIPARVHAAEKYKAAAVILYNSGPRQNDPKDMLSMRTRASQIPVVFVKNHIADQIQQQDNEEILMEVNIRPVQKTAYNVLGIIDNNAPYTLVLGAHYDHLGMGGHTSRYAHGPAIHPGADDNASGVAAIMELARQLKQEKDQRLNYLIIAFSAEEKGLIGSSHFLRSEVYDNNKIAAMMNLDMVGRMKDSTLRIAGTGTSPVWDSILPLAGDNKLQIETSRSGIGASDHTSFYMQNIPVLYYNTGIHSDYHKPSDTPDKINYPGILSVIDLAQKHIAVIPHKYKLPFQRTGTGDAVQRPPTRTVSLGVVPDHAYDGQGFRINRVMENRNAHNAGLKDGDVIIQMGDHEINGMASYMEALGKMKAGKTITIKVIRENKILKKTLTFQ